MSITIEVNNKKIEAKKDETILEVLNKNGIHVPTLCHIKGMLPDGACRMCLVEQKESGKLITSCSAKVYDGLEVLTHSPKVTEARKVIVELLLSNHPDDCLYCVRNLNCELQTLSENLNVRERRISGKKNQLKIDRSSPSIIRDPEKCILCGRCVRVCEEVMGVSAIDFVNRGNQSYIGVAFDKGLNISSCVNCGQCIVVCPTGALTEKNHFSEIIQALNDKSKQVVVQYAPAISVSLAEEFGLPIGTDMVGALNAALRKIGFNFVFDTTFAADLTIMEESAELIKRVQENKNLPIISSCCPSWVKYAEEFVPEFLDNVSSCKSPQQMMGSVIKSYFAEKSNIKKEDIYSVSLMPCTAKKFEAQREEMTTNGISDVDAVLTTRELVKFIRLYGVNMLDIEPEVADSPLGTGTSAGKLFGTSGGVAEAAIRTAYYKLTGTELLNFRIPEIRGFKNRKEAKIKIGDLELGVAVVNGLGNAKKLLDEISAGRSDIHFIEIMACPGGCIAGGGQPLNFDQEAFKKRAEALYMIDNNAFVKVSHKNPDVINLYNNYLKEPLGEKSHKLLHTNYTKRNVLK